MIKKFFIITVLLFEVTLIFGQQHNSEAENEAAPKTALLQAQKDYQKAIKEKNSPLLIQSLIRKIKYQSLIDTDSLPPMLIALEDYISKDNHVVEKSILHSLIAEIYHMYYQSQSSILWTRTPVTGYIPKDMHEWTANIYLEKIMQHSLDAVKAQPQLSAVNCLRYKEILILGKNSPALRPTMYDFLVYRSIDLLQQLYWAQQYFKQTELTNNRLLAPIEDFLQVKIDVPFYEINQHIVQLYQQLLRTQTAAKRTDAIIISDLDRLTFIKQKAKIKNKDSLYLNAIESLNRKYHDNPYSVEILNAIAQHYYQHYPNPKKQLPHYEKALNTCEEGIRRFPKYFRINILKNLISEIKRPSIYYTMNNNVYPGQKQQIRLHFQNVSDITFSMYQIQENMQEFLNSDKKNLNKKKVYSHTFRLPQCLVGRDTLLEIPVQSPGLYQLFMNTPDKSHKMDSAYFNSSRLSTIARKTSEKGYDLLVCDLMSGKPIPGAKVKLYKKSRSKYELLAEVTSDENGLAIIKNLNQDRYYQVTLGDDNHGPVNSMPYQHFNWPYALKNHTDLFTDRAVYRPGQTVYFNGICWDADTSGAQAITGRNYTVILRDANQQEIAKQNLPVNEFGSFSGSFTLPQEALNGEFTLHAGHASHTITVAEYKRPKFEITFNPLKQTYKLGDNLTISGYVKSYSGVNIENGKVNYNISETPLSSWITPKQPILAGTTQTNDKGEFQFSFNTPKASDLVAEGISPRYRLYQYHVAVTITSPNGETQEAEYIIHINSQNYHLEVNVSPKINKDQTVSIPIIAQNANGVPVSQKIHYTLSSLKELQELGDEYNYLNLPVDKEVLTGTFTTGGKDDLELNLSGYPSGAYLLTFNGDGEDKEISIRQVIYLYSLQDKRPPYPTYNWIVEEKTQCTPGENAEILFGTSAKEAYVLYEIYTNGQFVERKRFVMSDENIRFSIPYLDSYGKTADVLISYVKNEEFFQKKITLSRKQESKHLDIITQTFRDHLTPGQEEEWSFIIKNAQDKPVMAEMMATMYDASLDQFRENEWYFNPIYNYRSTTPFWREYIQNQQSRYCPFKSHTKKIPAFEYDRLNLYGFHLFYRNGKISVMLNRYSRGASKEEADLYYVAEDCGETTFDFAGSTDEEVMNTSMKSAPKAYARGIATQQTEAEVTPHDIPLRQNFRETAFFYPQLVTDSQGNIVIKFSVPEATTTWRFMALAHTQNMHFGQIEKSVITSKEFMVSTNLPRFVRTGDKVVLQATINNLTEKVQKGDAYLELFNPSTEVVLSKQSIPFNVSAQQNQTVHFEFTAPEDIDLLGCRIVANAQQFSDGEQHILPVVSNSTLITQTLPIFTMQQGAQTFTMDTPKGVSPYRFTLEFTANPIWYAVLALPTVNTPQTENVTDITASYYVSTVASAIATANPQITSAIKAWLANPKSTLTSPLAKNQELKSVLLQLSPWMTEAQNETERMHSLGELLDVNRQNYITRQALNKLAELQNEDGGWAWFKGFHSSTFMTENVLEAMSRLTRLGVTEHSQQVKEMQIKALNFLDRNIQNSFEKFQGHTGYSEILYLYARSAYRDIPLTKALAAHKYYLNDLEQSWTTLSLYEKALAAITLHRYGKQETARQIIRSLKEYSTTTPEMGMFWANNRSTLFTNSALQTHVAIMSAFHEIEGNTNDTELMKQWLLRQKQTQNWGNTPTTVDAIYALLLTGNDQLAVQENLSLKVGNHKLPLTPEESKLGYIKQSFSEKEITKKMLNVTLTKNTQQASWGGLYLQYFEKLDKISQHSGGISVQKQLFIEKNSKLVPLTGQSLKVGDKINIRITVHADQDMQYVHLKDLRAGCFEPTEQLSGNRWQEMLLYYQETTDVATNFFFDFLPKGTHVFEYTVWIAQSGTYQDGIATLQCIYAPQYSANSNAGNLIVQ